MTKTHGQDGHSNSAQERAERPAVTFDVSLYAHFLDEMGLTDEQKAAMLETLLGILIGFVDLGFGIHPLQTAHGQQDCGLNGQESPDSAQEVRDAVYSKKDRSPTIIEGDAIVLNAAGKVES